MRKRETFVIHILNQENATWQGQVVWLDGKQTKPFRSMLELIKMMDGVLEERQNTASQCGEAGIREER